MTLLVSLLFGVLSSGIIALADKQDRGKTRETEAELKKLLEKARKLRSTSDLFDILVTSSLRGLPVPKNESDRIAGCVASDPVLATDLAKWLLEPDPDEHDRQTSRLSKDISRLSNCAPETVKSFLVQLEDNINQELELSVLRNHEKLRVILEQLKEIENLKEIVLENRVILAEQMRKALKEENLSALIPVSPDPKPASKDNGLLHGERPSDMDMDQDIDFRRTRFSEVMDEIERAASSQLPVALLFKADAQRGKTTFLKRVGWELSLLNYPVLCLRAGSVDEPYAKWIISHAKELSGKPLILMIDDPAHSRDHFINQMLDFHDRSAPIIALIASRPNDWTDIKTGIVPFLQKALICDLNPDRFEAEKLIEKLLDRELISIAPEAKEQLLKEVEELPFGEGYFHKIIELADRKDFRPIPDLVFEALESETDSSLRESFERIYTFTCVSGIVGIPLPLEMLDHLTSETERYQARTFCDKMPRSPFRWEENFLEVTHEVHALEFLKEKDIAENLKAIVEIFVTKQELGDFIGELFLMYHARGLGKVAEHLWDMFSERVSDDHWQACSAASLTSAWGGFFYRSKLYKDSLEVNKVAVSQKPDDAAAHNNYAILLSELGETDAAKEHYGKALKINPDYTEAHYNYAILLEELEETASAKEHYENALKINPDHTAAHNNYAILLSELGETAAAREHYEKALKLNPDYADIHYNYAILLRELEETDAAREHFEKALKINPDYAEAHNNYANLLCELEETDAAREHFEKVLKINPDYAEAHYNYAILLKELEETDAAREHFETALKINPDYAEAHYNYAILLHELEETDAAREHFETALKINPDYTGAHYNYAILLRELEETDAAREHYEKALKINPDHAEALGNLAMMEIEEGDTVKALDHTSQAVRSGRLPDHGILIVRAFSAHREKLTQIINREDQPSERLGLALAILSFLDKDKTIETGKDFSQEAVSISRELLDLWLSHEEDETD